MSPALFLDRDGIINIDHGYISKIEDFQFADGIFDLLPLFIDKGYLLFIVTNQSGIGRGYYTLDDFEKLTEWMLLKFKEENIEIQSVQHCPHAPNDHCTCRKPKIGMIEAILKDSDIDVSHSWLIGDKQSDIDLARNANISHTIAIGDREIKNMTYKFDTVLSCKKFIKTHQDTLL